MSRLAPEIVHALEQAEVAATRSWSGAAPEATKGALGIGMRDIGPALAVCVCAADILAYNRVVGLGVGAEARPSQIEEALAFFRAASVPRFMVQVAPETMPLELTDWLAARGFYRHNQWLRLYRSTTDVDLPIDPRVRRIGREHAEVFARTNVEAYGHSEVMIPWLAAGVGCEGWQHFGSFEDGEPVGFAALHTQGRAAWFGFACTRATHRRRGVQSGRIATRLRVAAELDCEFASVETADDTPEKSNPSTHNLRRLGFEDAYRRSNWVLNLVPRPPSGAAPAAGG